MNTSPLKIVLVLDPERHRYKPVAHNLSPAQAVDVQSKHSGEGKTVKTIEQAKHHRHPDASQCRTCRDAAQRASKAQAHAGHDQRGAGEPVAEPGEAVNKGEE